MAILIGSKAASRTVMQRPANKTFDMVLAANALSSYDSGSNPDSGASFFSHAKGGLVSLISFIQLLCQLLKLSNLSRIEDTLLWIYVIRSL